MTATINGIFTRKALPNVTGLSADMIVTTSARLNKMSVKEYCRLTMFAMLLSKEIKNTDS